MKRYQCFVIQIVVIVVLVIFGILEVKRATDKQIGHSKAETRFCLTGNGRARVLCPHSVKVPLNNDLSSVVERKAKTESLENLVNAIFKAEGSHKAKYLYGIQSVKYSSKAKARQACEETIINNYSRWIKKGCPGEYLEFLSKVYCPYNSETWLKNVKYFLGVE